MLDEWSRRRGLDDSLVVFFSDHGEHLPSDPEGVFGHGQSMHEALLHIPLVVKFPRSAGVEPGLSATPASLVDLAPMEDGERG